MTDAGDAVTYDWPEGGGAPFDASDDETRWVLVAGSRFGRTWPAGDRRDFGSWDASFERRVPMGYKVIQLAERLAVVDHGTVVREWPSTGLTATGQPPPPPVSDPYQHHVPGVGAPEGPWAVLDGDGGQRGPDGQWISHEHGSYAAALAAARSRSESRVLVVRLLQTVNWH